MNQSSLFYFFVFMFGASIGSFLNVLIDRLPNEETLMGRSHCDFCGKKLVWYDLFPLFSYLFLRGKCRYCHKKLSWQYPFIEALTGLIFLVIVYFYPALGLYRLLALIGIACSLLVIFVSDLKYHLISDYLLLSFFVFSLFFHYFDGMPAFYILKEYISSGLIVSLPIFLIYFLSHEKAMGLGDVILTAIIGFLLGWKSGYMALYIAFVTGAIYGVSLMVIYRKKIKSRIPFGPFLVFGTIVMFLWGSEILGIISKIYGF